MQTYLHLQLLPCNGFPGVLGGAEAVALKQLRLCGCVLDYDREPLAAALSQLRAGLQHLSLSHLYIFGFRFPANVLQQLTCLEFVGLFSDLDNSPALQPLQELTLLADLRLSARDENSVSAILPSRADRPAVTRL